ncbi:MAG TPA: hypothetical protein PKA61_15590 [Nitrospira sp.]|nr:hypothetical protein [Nitrospira sp.]
MAEIQQAVGRELTEDEIRRLDKQVTKLVDKLQVQKHAEAFDTLLMKEIEKAGDLAQAAAIIEKRNAVKNKVAQIAQMDYLKTTWADDPAEGIKALLGGTMTGRKGGKKSTGTLQDALSDTYLMGAAADLDRAGLTQWVANGSYDKQIWTAMWELNKTKPDEKVLSALPNEAREAAAILNKWTETARINANKAGAWIKKLDGYVTRHSHDQLRIKEAGPDTWMQDITDWLDWEKTMPDVEPDRRGKVLRNLYSDFVSGKHLKFESAPTPGLTGAVNVGRALSHERVLHFKHAEAEYQYNLKYGQGNLREAVFANLARMGRETALMRMWGPNARANYDAVVDQWVKQLREAGEDDKRAALENAKEKLDRIVWPLLDGDIYRVERALLARRSATIRGIEMMSDLGATVGSSIVDLPIMATGLRQQGVGMFEGMAEGIQSLFHGVTTGERMHILAETGVVLDEVRNTVSERIDPSGGQTGSIARMTNLYFKLNLLRPWTDRLRGGFVLATAHRLANHSHLDFPGLPPGMQHLLQQYGIGPEEWGIIRQGKESHADGKAFLTPEGLTDLPAETFAAYVTRQDKAPTAHNLDAAREDLKDRLRSFFQDQATTAVVQPDMMTKASMLQGTHRGTWQGEAIRHFWMYKSFTMAVMRRVLGRELFGYGDVRMTIPEALVAMFKDPRGSAFVGMANLIASTAVFGYAAMTLKDMAKGREPRSATTTDEYVKILSAAMLQGGGLGLYGDFLFGEAVSRFGSGPLESFMGPTWRRGSDIYTLMTSLREGQDVTGRTITKVFNSTPFVNLFYTRWALDYLVLYRLQEMANPGYLRRMEERVRQDKHQQFIIPPSSVIPYGG